MPKNESDPEDPLELCGVGLLTEEDTSEAMTECFVEEFMRLGHTPGRILALFRNPHYTGMNMVFQNRGEAFIRDKITEVFARWGSVEIRRRTHPPAAACQNKQIHMKNQARTILSALALALTTTVNAQYGKKFSAPSFVPTAVRGAYYYGSGQLSALVETTPANEEAWVFVNNATGELQGSLRLDSKHGALASPDGREILIAGNSTVSLQPVYFAGRYNATDLQPIAEMQMDVTADDGYNLAGEVSPDGGFVFRGQHTSQIDIIAKYGTDFLPQWGASLTYHGAFQPLNLEAFPLPSGDVGFWMIFPGFGAGGTAYQTNVVGLLNSTNGSLKWSGVYTTTQTGMTQEDHRFIFGPDGSFFLSIKTVNLLAPDTDTIRLARVAADGTLAYSKTLTVPTAIHEHQYYLGGGALVYYTFKEAGADRIQFIVLDENGNLTGNTALNCKLRGSGQIKLTAARREGTGFAFIRLECGFAGFTLPEQTLARLDLASGNMDLRKLPSPAPGVETYEVVTTPKGDVLSPHHNFRGIAAVTTAIVGSTELAGGGSTVAFYELPANGDLPTCLPLSASSAAVGTPLAPQLSNSVHIDLADGASVSSRAMPGMTTPLALPTLQATPVTAVVVCEDDGTAEPAPTLTIVHTPPGQATISWTPPTPGFALQERTNLIMGNWSNSSSGTINPVTVPATIPMSFYRLFKP